MRRSFDNWFVAHLYTPSRIEGRSRDPGRARWGSRRSATSRTTGEEPPREMLGKPDGVFFLIADKMSADERGSAFSRRAGCARRRSRVTYRSDRTARWPTAHSTGATHSGQVATTAVAERSQPPDGLSFWNGFGGFTPDGREYVIVIDGISQRQTRRCLRLPGRMCSPIRSSDVWSRRLVLATAGRATAK